MKAMYEFYDNDAKMQESVHPPTAGLGANSERKNRS